MSLIKFWKNVVRTESYEYFTNSIKKNQYKELSELQIEEKII